MAFEICVQDESSKSDDSFYTYSKDTWKVGIGISRDHPTKQILFNFIQKFLFLPYINLTY